MTSSQPFASQAKTEAQLEQCMLYLLGEMDASQSRAFEQQLQGSPQLAEDLLRQADMIAALSASPPCSTPTSTATATTLPTNKPQWPSSPAFWPVTIAASIALLVIGLRLVGTVGNEDQMIARAWADHQLNQPQDDFGLPEPERDEAIWLSEDDPRQNDTTIAWMFAAVSSGDAALLGESATAETDSDG